MLRAPYRESKHYVICVLSSYCCAALKPLLMVCGGVGAALIGRVVLLLIGAGVLGARAAANADFMVG